MVVFGDRILQLNTIGSQSIKNQNNKSSPEVRDLLGDADVLPNQVRHEVVYLFTNSNTRISSHPPSAVTVEDDDESIRPRCRSKAIYEFKY